MQLWLMKTTHHWLGVLFAAFFFVISLSGVWLTIERYTLPAIFDGDMRANVQILDAAAAGQAAAALNSPDVTQIDFPIKGRAIYTVYNAERASYYSQDLQALRVINTESFASRLHAGLLNLFGIGPSIVVCTGMIGAWIAVLGIIISVPQLRGFRKDRLLIPHELSFRDVRRTHMSSGLVFGVFVIFFSFSGWVLGAPKDVNAIFKALDSNHMRGIEAGYQRPGQEPEHAAKFEPIEVGMGLSEMVQLAMARTANAQPTQLIWNDKTHLDIYLSSDNDMSARGHNRVSFDMGDSTIQVTTHNELSASARFIGAADSFHSGKEMGVVYHLLICLLGIAIALIAMTGLLSYYLKWKIKITAFLTRRRKAKLDIQNES